MADTSGRAALALVEALIEQLEAEGILDRQNINGIYDRAIARAQTSPKDSGGIEALLKRLARRRQ